MIRSVIVYCRAEFKEIAMSESQSSSGDPSQRPVLKKREGDYPVSESFKVLEGYDISRSNNFIVALVVVESGFGRDIRLYRWQKRNEAWKVDLCRMSVDFLAVGRDRYQGQRNGRQI